MHPHTGQQNVISIAVGSTSESRGYMTGIPTTVEGAGGLTLSMSTATLLHRSVFCKIRDKPQNV